MAAPQISLAAEPVLHMGPLILTNSNLTTSLLVLSALFLLVPLRRRLGSLPGKLQSGLEVAYEGLYGLFGGVIGRADVTRELFPFLFAGFFFIVLSNWSGLVPGFGTITVPWTHGGATAAHHLFRAPTADLNTVIALAVISVGYVQYLGAKFTGPRAYAGKFFTLKDPISAFIGIVELISELTRVISYSFRLFGNVFAGEVLISVILYLTTALLPYVPLLPLPFYFLEAAVAVIQGFVFCFLTAVFAAVAVAGHGHGESGRQHAAEPATT